MGQRWGLERISNGEQTQIRHTKVASKGAWRATWSQGQEGIIIFENKAVGGEEEGDYDAWVEQAAELGDSRNREDVGEVVDIVIKYGCHGEQYLINGLKVLVPEVSKLIRVDGGLVTGIRCS